MSTQTIAPNTEAALLAADVEAATDAEDDPFGLDITFLENTPATEAQLACSTGDTCGSSCPSACTTS